MNFDGGKAVPKAVDFSLPPGRRDEIAAPAAALQGRGDGAKPVAWLSSNDEFAAPAAYR
jgi:hypothetical protein